MTEGTKDIPDKEFRVNFCKTVFGYVVILAPSKEEAVKHFSNGDWDDECDNKSSYTFEGEDEGDGEVEMSEVD